MGWILKASNNEISINFYDDSATSGYYKTKINSLLNL